MSSGRLYSPVPKKSRQSLLTVRLTPELMAEFYIAAELRGATRSSLVHQFIVKTIREERQQQPDAFTPERVNVALAEISEKSAAKKRGRNAGDVQGAEALTVHEPEAPYGRPPHRLVE